MTWRVCRCPPTTCRPGSSRQRPGSPASWPAACAHKESSCSRPPLEPAPAGPAKHPGGPGRACSQPGKQQRAETRGHFVYLTLLDIFFFFLILFKLKPSKVVPDKSEGCRGSGLSFLLLTTSAKDNTGLWLNHQARRVPTGLREALSTCRGLPASQPAS